MFNFIFVNISLEEFLAKRKAFEEEEALLSIQIFPASLQKKLLGGIQKYFEEVSSYLVRKHDELQQMRKTHNKILNTKGELSPNNIAVRGRECVFGRYNWTDFALICLYLDVF